MQFLGSNKNNQTDKFAEKKVNIQYKLNVYMPATNNKIFLNDTIYHETILILKEKPHEDVYNFYQKIKNTKNIGRK